MLNSIQKYYSNSKIYIIGFVIFVGFFGVSCISVKPVYFDDDKKVAQIKVEEFHQLFNDEKFQEMYNLFSTETRGRLTFENFNLAFKELRTEVGRVKKTKLVKDSIKTEASYRVVELIYETEFEKFTLRERFLCFTDGENAVIHYYEKPSPISN